MLTLGIADRLRNPGAIAWAKSFIELVDSLQKYVKQWHTTGVTWDLKVGDTRL